jgi:hypothetical protein
MDQSSDLSASRLHRLATLYGAPAYVKEAGVVDLTGDGLAPSVYADQARRLYPIHTKAATWASYAYFLDNARRPGDDRVEARLREAAAAHGVADDLDALDAAVRAGRVKAALADDDFAVRFEADGQPVRHLPVRNPREVKAACDYLRGYRTQIPFPVASAAARRVLAKQAALAAPLADADRDFLEKLAGEGTGSALAAADLLRHRVEASRLGGGPLTPPQAGLSEMAEKIGGMNPAGLDRRLRLKIAALVDEFDDAYGLKTHVRAGRLEAPEDVLFAHTLTKLAGVLDDHCETPAGSVYKVADLAALSLAVVRDRLGADLAEAMTDDGVHLNAQKAARVVPTLARPDCRAFEELMAEYGKPPVAKAAASRQIDRGLLARLYFSAQVG